MQAPLTFKARCFGTSLSTGLKSWVPNVGKALLLRGSWGLWVPSWWWITALGLGFRMRLCLRLSYPFWCRFFSFIWYVLSGGNLGSSCFPNYHFICYVSIFSSYGTGCNIRRGATPLRKELYIFLIISHLSLLVSFSPTLCKLFHVAGDMFIHSLEFISSQFRELTGMKKFPKASAWKNLGMVAPVCIPELVTVTIGLILWVVRSESHTSLCTEVPINEFLLGLFLSFPHWYGRQGVMVNAYIINVTAVSWGFQVTFLVIFGILQASETYFLNYYASTAELHRWTGLQSESISNFFFVLRSIIS